MAATLLAYGLIPLEEIDHVFFFAPSKAGQAYAESFLAITYLRHTAGPDAVQRLVQEMARGRDFRHALELTCDYPVSTFLEGWKTFVHREYGALSSVSSLFSAPYFWVGCATLFLVVYIVKRYTSRKAAEQWEEEEQSELEDSTIEFPEPEHNQ
jgi:hypothetical protein